MSFVMVFTLSLSSTTMRNSTIEGNILVDYLQRRVLGNVLLVIINKTTLRFPNLTTWSLFFIKISNLQLMIVQKFSVVLSKVFEKSCNNIGQQTTAFAFFSTVQFVYNKRRLCSGQLCANPIADSKKRTWRKTLYVKPFIVLKKSFNHKK